MQDENVKKVDEELVKTNQLIIEEVFNVSQLPDQQDPNVYYDEYNSKKKAKALKGGAKSRDSVKNKEKKKK
ncbi:hypothetical protein HDU92_002496 [Lobulomyces angularis]|nr:hypothetical protein HDU92_002496 [Lobulomyces angularis]